MGRPEGSEMAKLELDPDEQLLTEGTWGMLQGRKVKFPVWGRYVITNKRFLYQDMGKMAPMFAQLGILLRLFVRGRMVGLPLQGLRLSRGKYGLNRKILEITASDGRSVLFDRFDKALDMLRTGFETSGIGLYQTGEEEWTVQS
jgi:hypothetical protein